MGTSSSYGEPQSSTGSSVFGCVSRAVGAARIEEIIYPQVAGARCKLVDEATPAGVGGGRSAVGHAGLAEDAMDMLIHGADADH